MPKISIIIPIYNVSSELKNTLNSVLSQSMNDIEIICVEDCSSDGSKEILHEYEKLDTRIKCIYHETNLGTSQSRKDGVAIACGKYVMFLDGDVELKSDVCAKAFAAIEENSVDIVQFDTEVANEGCFPENKIRRLKKFLKPFLGRVDGDLIKACWKERKFSWNLWNKIYKADICKTAFQLIEDGVFPKA